MLEAENLSKRYGGILAVDHVSFTARPGEVFGLLGSNGAGKTTIMKIFATLLRPSSGRARVDGLDVRDRPLDVRRVLGFVPEAPVLPDKLTGYEFLTYLGRLRDMAPDAVERGLREVDGVLDLDRELDLELDAFSRGMRQKIALAAAMFHRPKVLVLDEPTNGLDPRFARRLKDRLVAMARDGATVMLSTHVTEIAEAVCDRVAILHEGRIAAIAPVGEVIASVDADNLEDAFVRVVDEA